MIEFGKTLRMAREAKGLTPGQVAERTHMIVQTVEGLEREDFSKIVAPIYGRGFVKLYCEAVGLEPKPLVTPAGAAHPPRKARRRLPRLLRPHRRQSQSRRQNRRNQLRQSRRQESRQ